MHLFTTGLLYRPYEQMQDLYEKLIVLRYHEECVKMSKIRPIHSLYFTTPMNPGEQYYNFVTIASWLIKKCGRTISMPQESDDPNLVISGILEHIRQMVKVSFIEFFVINVRHTVYLAGWKN